MNPKPSLPCVALLWVVCGLAAGCAPTLEPVTTCEPKGDARPICGMQNPEDLAVLPGELALIVSQFGTMDGAQSGNLATYDLANDAVNVVFPNTADPPQAEAGWGDANCPGPPSPAFSPHGIDLEKRPDGRLRLLVVNHGGRESVEIFEVLPFGRVASVRWRGCAVPPEGSYLNDVVALPDGGFLATHMFPKSGAIVSAFHLIRGLLSMEIGHVLEWQPDTGFRKVPGTGAPFPNGIEVSDDGGIIYLNVYMAGQLRRIDRRTGEVLGVVTVASPDNVTWGEDGRLLVASHEDGRETMGCNAIDAGACPAAYAIVAIDPETQASEVVYRNAGAPMGAGTVAVEVAGELFIGSFKSDRIVRAPKGGSRR
jgi:hypothetical protein